MRDWLKVTFEGESYATKDHGLAIKLAKKKNKNKPGRYFRDGGVITYWEKKVLGKWKTERFADKACTRKVSEKQWK